MALTKSWLITLASIIIAVTMIILPSFGVTGISESQVTNLIYVALGLSGIGAANATGKRIAKGKVQSSVDDYIKTGFAQEPTQTAPQIIPQISHSSKLKDNGDYYTTNMTKDKSGNVIQYGEPFLYAKLKDTRSYTTAKLSRDNNLIQIEQSGVNEPVRLELFEKVNGKVVPMARGDYVLQITGDRGTGDSNGVTDQFQII